MDVDVVAADHDWSCFKVTPSVTVTMNIGEDPVEFLLSCEVDGRGRIYASLHDAIFKKSIIFHHVAQILRILRCERIEMLLENNLIPETCRDVGYNDLKNDQRTIVNNHMHFVFGFEADGGGNHNHDHGQNFLTMVDFFFLCGCDKLFAYRC